MLTYFDIKQSLDRYDKNKSKWRKFFDLPEISKLRSFARDNVNVLGCYDLFEVIVIIHALRNIIRYGSFRRAEDELIANLVSNVDVENLVCAIDLLKKRNILIEDNFETILTAHSRIFSATAVALANLDSGGILTPENRYAVNRCLSSPIVLVKILLFLSNARIMLTAENRSILVKQTKLEKMYFACVYMSPLTQADFDAFCYHEKPWFLARMLNSLAIKGILNQQTRDAVKKHAEPDQLTYALIYLNDPSVRYHISKDQCSESLFTLENIAAVSQHADPLNVVYALVYLYKKKMLTTTNRELVKYHLRPKSLAFALAYLRRSNLLTPENRQTVNAHPRIKSVVRACRQMYHSRCLTQVFFSQVIKATKPEREVKALLLDIPRLQRETYHPYTKGAIHVLFIQIKPNFPRDITGIVAQYISRSTGGRIARTCKRAATAAQEAEKARYRL